MNHLTCIVVEDEIMAIKLLESYINQVQGLQLIRSFSNPLHAIEFLQSNPVDLVFLDIQMPQMKGMDVAALISPETMVVFITAYAEYAVESYDYQAVDYLVKPVRFDRFHQSVDRAMKKKNERSENKGPTLLVKSGYDVLLLDLSEVEYVSSMKEYVAFHLLEKRVVCYMSIRALMERLPDELFVRIHRSYIANTQYVKALKGRSLELHSTTLPISRSYYSEIKKRFSD